jgi:hypothetical protein
MTAFELTIRAASPDDSRVLQKLAELDSAPRLTGRALLAEADGVAIAAISLETGAVVADPFTPTATAVRVLRLRRYQLTRQGGHWPRRPLLWRDRAYRTS